MDTIPVAALGVHPLFNAAALLPFLNDMFVLTQTRAAASKCEMRPNNVAPHLAPESSQRGGAPAAGITYKLKSSLILRREP